jgi:hypothetical protein
VLPPPAPGRQPPAARERDGAAAVAEQSRGLPADDAHAHPITPEHVRLYAHRRLGHAIDDATDAHDVGALRALLDQYHREYPADDFGVEAAYRLILDCFEHPGADARAAAARWLDQNNGSVVKRSIVRYCLDEPP